MPSCWATAFADSPACNARPNPNCLGLYLSRTRLAWLGLQAVENLYRGYQHLVHLDPMMLTTAIGLATLSAILAGLYPVWRVSRLAPAGLLKTQ